MASVPPTGQLDERPLPRLLLELYRKRYTGGLTLAHARVTKTVQLREGEPVRVTSSRGSESLAKLLAYRGTLSDEDAERIAHTAAERGCPEEAALVALKLIGPRDLVLAMRDATRQRLLECFAWPAGEFRCEGEAAPAGSQAFRLHPIPLVRDGLAAHWAPERMLADLGAKLEGYPVKGDGFGAAAALLIEEQPAAALLAALHEDQVVWSTLQGANHPTAVASLWVLDTLGVLEFRATPPGEAPEAQQEKPEAPASPETELEIVISDQPARAAPSTASSPSSTGRVESKRSGGKDDELELLRKEVLAKHERLSELDYYELLGVAPDTKTPQIKRAYLVAAKRFHPDALTRRGLDDIHAQANEVFAQIAKAHETLTDPTARQSYDAALGGEEEIDLDRLAQAEMLYRKGEIVMRTGGFNGALEFFEGAVQLWPEDAAYQGSLGWVLFKKTPPDLPRAREHLAKAIALAPDDATAHHRLSSVLRELGDPDAAQRALATARRIDPSIKG